MNVSLLDVLSVVVLIGFAVFGFLNYRVDSKKDKTDKHLEGFMPFYVWHIL